MAWPQGCETLTDMQRRNPGSAQSCLFFYVIHQRCGWGGGDWRDEQKDEEKEKTEGGAGPRDERTLGVVTARCVAALNSTCSCSSVLALVRTRVDWAYPQLDGCEN